MSLLHPKDKGEFEKILSENDKKLIVVDFFATWCGPCIAIAPTFKEWAGVYTDVAFVKIDVDDKKFAEVVSTYKISAMPTFKFIKGSKVIHEVLGANKSGIESKIKELK